MSRNYEVQFQIFKRVKLLNVICLGFLFAAPSTALATEPTFKDKEGFKHTCRAPHHNTGQMVPVSGRNTGGGDFYAMATWDSTGIPMILLNKSRLLKIPVPVQRFVYYRECAFLRSKSQDESKANCEALRQMRREGIVSSTEEKSIREYILEKKWNPGNINHKTKLFWNREWKNCAASNTQMAVK